MKINPEHEDIKQKYPEPTLRHRAVKRANKFMQDKGLEPTDMDILELCYQIEDGLNDFEYVKSVGERASFMFENVISVIPSSECLEHLLVSLNSLMFEVEKRDEPENKDYQEKTKILKDDLEKFKKLIEYKKQLDKAIGEAKKREMQRRGEEHGRDANAE